jgi:thiosulfate/3-mercaptopyruvate sulfurtransferase
MRLRLMWASRKLKFFNPKTLVFVAVLLACLIAMPLLPTMASSPSSRIQFVSPAWVSTNAKDPNLRILDVRNAPLDYIAGHVANAVNIADTAFRGPNGFLPVQYWNEQKLEQIFTASGVTNIAIASVVRT